MALYARIGLIYQGEPIQKDEMNSVEDQTKKSGCCEDLLKCPRLPSRVRGVENHRFSECQESPNTNEEIATQMELNYSGRISRPHYPRHVLSPV
jgi:hypothetical protein